MQCFKRNRLMLLTAATVIWFVQSCTSQQEPTLFTPLPQEKTGIRFNNKINENPDQENGINIPRGSRTQSAVNEFLYMGGGVGIGDFNNDGWQDIFFSGNQVSSRLYINVGLDEDGNVQFEDITEQAGVSTEVWATGVSIADINNDGFDDIYICVYGGKNRLFINEGSAAEVKDEPVPTFTEQAEEYGLADSSASTQAVFFDYNRDGKTDLFLTNYRLNGPNPNMLLPKNLSGNSPANDKLYQNTGIREGKNHPVFADVSKEAGIKGNGYGLGVVATDINRDGWPDLYVANDFLYGDELWLNDKDGTFTNAIGHALRHQSYSSMGVDAADINNDRLIDIITLDMEPELNEREKMQYTFMNQDRFQKEQSMGYEPAFMRNMLQLNNGIRSVQGREIPFFSEIGQYAGIAETDWSWSVLAADFTNDGWKDIYITNGSGHDYLNADFIEYSLSEEVNNKDEKQRRSLLNRRLRSLGFIRLPNYFYRNNRDPSGAGQGYTFANLREESGVNNSDLSNGAAYGDLDNDGDLDLIVSNINEPASVFLNNTINNREAKGGVSADSSAKDHHYLQVKLTGPENNRDAFGAAVQLSAGGTRQIQEKYPVRGYLSSVDSRLFFGLGSAEQVDSLVVIWPDSHSEVFRDIPSDTLLNIRYQGGGHRTNATVLPQSYPLGKNPAASEQLFREVTNQKGISYKHVDVAYNDFDEQPLLPQKYSQLGPFITEGDVDHNGLTDFFVGGGFNSSGALFKQIEAGVFEYVQFDSTIKYQEDMDAVFFDSNGNGHLDLLITYGDTRYDENSIYYKPRLYINDGKGNFRLRPDAIPDHVRTIAGTVAAADFDDNGRQDLFIGGRVSKMYPLSPRSFLLRNENGIFKDVTNETAPELINPGMVSSAVWADVNGDNTRDLVIAGEWMPVRFFINHKTHFQEITNQTGLKEMKGLWRSLEACDVNRDGTVDFVAGNLGKNTPYRVTPRTPLKLFAADLNENGLTDPILFYYRRDRSGSRNLYPAVNRDKLLRQVPGFQNIFPTHEEYSTARLDDLFGHLSRNDWLELTAKEMRSVYLENRGDGTFKKHPLPAEVQFAPVNAIVCEDLDDDGYMDLLLAGNEYQVDVRTGRYDASYGTFLNGDDQNGFTVIPPAENGFLVDGDVKDMSLIADSLHRKLVLVAVNDDSLRMFEVRP